MGTKATVSAEPSRAEKEERLLRAHAEGLAAQIPGGVIVRADPQVKAVPRAIRLTCAAAARVRDLAWKLETELAPVLHGEKCPPGTARTAGANDVEVVKAIGEATDDLDGAELCLRSILDRLEV